MQSSSREPSQELSKRLGSLLEGVRAEGKGGHARAVGREGGCRGVSAGGDKGMDEGRKCVAQGRCMKQRGGSQDKRIFNCDLLRWNYGRKGWTRAVVVFLGDWTGP